MPLAADLRARQGEATGPTPRGAAGAVFGNWLRACPLIAPVLLLPVLVVMGRSLPEFVAWRGLLALIAYMLSISFATISLGVAGAAWFAHRGLTLGRRLALTHLALGAAFVFLIPWLGLTDIRGLSLSIPLVGVTVLTSVLRDTQTPELEVINWAITFALAYAMAAFALLCTTIASFNRPGGRVSPEQLRLQLIER
jgi:hypothetical protein